MSNSGKKNNKMVENLLAFFWLLERGSLSSPDPGPGSFYPTFLRRAGQARLRLATAFTHLDLRE